MKKNEINGLERLSVKLHLRTTNLRNSLRKIISTEQLESLAKPHNPFYQLNKMEEQDKQIKKWIDLTIKKFYSESASKEIPVLK